MAGKYDTVFWTESQAATTPTNVAALTIAAGEDQYTVNGDGVRVKPRAPWLVGVGTAYETDTGGETYIFQNEQKIKYKFPVGGADTGTLERLKLIVDLRATPMPLVALGAADVFAQVAHKTNEQATVAAFLGTGPIVPYSGPIDHYVKFESTTTTTVDQLSEVTLSLDETLPEGRYAIVGVNAQSQAPTLASSPMYGRWKFTDSLWRPGFLVTEGGNDSGNFSDTVPQLPFNNMPLNKDWSFKQDDLPRVQLLTAVAATEHTFYAKLVQLSGVKNF